jgi:type III pantothenate kinase
MKLLIDVGNTRVKWALAEHHDLTKTGAIVNSAVDFAILLATWQVFDRPDLVAISCVNSPQLSNLLCAVLSFLWPECPVIMANTKAFECGVDNAYIQPEKLGVDRWLALIAAHNSYRCTACIVDCGTAITVDMINAQGQHQGGLISPGLALMRQALAGGTHQLPLNEHTCAFGIANNTEAGIYTGILSAACGLIERVVNQYTDDLLLILTGGDAEVIASQLTCESKIDEHLVLRGLIYIT